MFFYVRVVESINKLFFMWSLENNIVFYIKVFLKVFIFIDLMDSCYD